MPQGLPDSEESHSALQMKKGHPEQGRRPTLSVPTAKHMWPQNPPSRALSVLCLLLLRESRQATSESLD